MKDWTLLARAMAPDLSEEAAARAAASLNALEAAFRPLVVTLPLTAEPAILFRMLDAKDPQ